MEEKLLDYLSSNMDRQYAKECKNERGRFYKELEETILDYVSKDIRVTTNKVKGIEDMEKVYMEEGRFYFQETCQKIESISPEGVAEKLGHIVSEGLDQNVMLIKFVNLLNRVFEDINFLSMVVALVSLFEKKKEGFIEQEKYDAILNRHKKLSEMIEFLGEKNNVQMESLKNDMSLDKEELEQIKDDGESLFNVRQFGQNTSVSLTPKGRKIQKHIRQRKQKSYTKEDVENYIYINSHHIMKSFYSSSSEISENAFVFPLSQQRKRKLSLEYRLIRKEIDQQKEVIDAGNTLGPWFEERLSVFDFHNIMEDKCQDERSQGFDSDISGTFTEYFRVGR